MNVIRKGRMAKKVKDMIRLKGSFMRTTYIEKLNKPEEEILEQLEYLRTIGASEMYYLENFCTLLNPEMPILDKQQLNKIVARHIEDITEERKNKLKPAIRRGLDEIKSENNPLVNRLVLLNREKIMKEVRSTKDHLERYKSQVMDYEERIDKINTEYIYHSNIKLDSLLDELEEIRPEEVFNSIVKEKIEKDIVRLAEEGNWIFTGIHNSSLEFINTVPIICKDPTGRGRVKEVNCGHIVVRIIFTNSTPYIQVDKLYGNKDTTEFHPHMAENTVCLGEHKYQCLDLLNNFKIYDFFRVFNSILNNYYAGNPYITLNRLNRIPYEPLRTDFIQNIGGNILNKDLLSSFMKEEDLEELFPSSLEGVSGETIYEDSEEEEVRDEQAVEW